MKPINANQVMLTNNPLINNQELIIDDPFNKQKIELENLHKEKILKLHTAKDQYNELTYMQPKDNVESNGTSSKYRVFVPQASLVSKKQQMINRNFNLRNMQQICANYNKGDEYPDIIIN